MTVGDEIVILASTPAGQEAILKMIGPAADYIGSGGRSLAKAAVDNVQSVFAKGARKLGDEINEPGGLPPKVMRDVINEAITAEDEFVQDYLGGVLASARSAEGRDDRGAAHARLVGDLSTYALRTHYLLYASSQRIAKPEHRDPLRQGGFSAQVFVPFSEYMAGLALSETEQQMVDAIVTDSLHTLVQRGLLGNFKFGHPVVLAEPLHRRLPSFGLVASLTQFGVLFFTAACGVKTAFSEAWLGDPQRFALESGPSLPRATWVDDLPPASGPNDVLNPPN